MRWVLALGWFLLIGGVWADTPMDLDSPFLKTALIQEKTGEITEKTVRKGKLDVEVVELEKEDGGLLVLPKSQVLAVLPRLPQAGAAYLQSDAQKALKVLQRAQPGFPLRTETSAETIAEWQRLATKTTESDQIQSKALEAWMERCNRLPSDSSAEQIEKMWQEGFEFIGRFPQRAQEIERELRSLREMGSVDLKQIEALQLELGAVEPNVIVGLALWALVTIPFVFALKVLVDAFQPFREGLHLAALLRVVVGGLALAFLAALLTNGKLQKTDSVSRIYSSSTSARKAAWYSLNHQEKWSDQGAKKISLPSSDWLAFLDEKITEGSGGDSFPFWHLAKPSILASPTSLTLVQPLEAKILTLPVHFTFALPASGQSMVDLELTGASAGRIPIGALGGKLLWNLLATAYQPFVEKCGLTQGVRWLAGENNTIIVEVPDTQKPKPQAKESLSAQELAEVFHQGHGAIYKDKYVTVSGTLDEVVSRREDLGLGSRLSREDDLDSFYLVGLPESGMKKRIRIRCQIKDKERVFFLDGRGDLYFKMFTTVWADGRQEGGGDGPKGKKPEKAKSVVLDQERSLDPLNSSAVFRKGGEVRFASGRVESDKIELETITVYDCLKFEVRDQGGEWRTVWEAVSK